MSITFCKIHSRGASKRAKIAFGEFSTRVRGLRVLNNNHCERSFCDLTNPHLRLTLLVTRVRDSEPHVVAAGTYMRRNETTAEVAMANDDALQGNGIGAILLERLALIAVSNGIRRFEAVTMAENRAMLEVFRNSGFECRSQIKNGYAAIDLDVVPSQASVERAELRDRVSTAASLRVFFRPRAVAIVGASRNPTNIGTRILQGMLAAGFKGAIYPVNPCAWSARTVWAC